MRLHSAFVLFLAITACGNDNGVNNPVNGRERLTARPISTTTTATPGSYPLSITATKDARLIIPQVAGSNPIPLVVMLHGAGGDEAPVEVLAAAAAQHGVAVMIPKSRAGTWDLAMGGFGEDVSVIDDALKETFRRLRVDPQHIALAGFSDGASYALTLGIANGDLFTHLIAIAPGFMSPVNRFGSPDIFIAHGTQDVITSPRNSEENIAPFLRTLGYNVLFHSFSGSHQVSTPVATAALDWFIAN